MKKLYSAPIADLIETEMDNVLAGVSFNVIDDPPGPGFAETKSEGVFESDNNSNGIFDY